jgi:hypothetical protein
MSSPGFAFVVTLAPARRPERERLIGSKNSACRKF